MKYINPKSLWRWKLSTQIFTGFALMSLLLVGVAFTGYWSLREVTHNFDDAVNRTQPVLTALQQIRLRATTLVLSVAQPPAHSSIPAQDNPAIQLQASVAKYQALIEKFFPDERDNAKEIQELTQDLLARAAQREHAGATDNTAGTDASLGQIQEALVALSAAVAKAALGEEEDSPRRKETSTARLKSIG